MSTTSLISRRPIIYTVVGDAVPGGADNTFSAVVMPRGDHPFMSSLLNELNQFNPHEIIVFNERFSARSEWAPLRQIRAEAPLSAAEMVNIAVEEARGSFVFVLWSDMKFESREVSTHVFSRIEERGDLCVTPQFFTKDNERIPSVSAPAFDSKGFRLIRTNEAGFEARTFAPLDFSGVYNRARFLNMGGFDPSIPNPYWQKCDFALRAALWGERIAYNAALRVTYAEDPPVDDNSFDLSSRIFALKNLGPRVRRTGAYLPLSWLRWALSMRGGYELYKEIKGWIRENRFRFKLTAEEVADRWRRS